MVAKFKSGWDYIHFSEAVRRSYRFAHSDEVKTFISNLIETSESRTRTVEKGQCLWRAQIGYDTIDREIVGEEDTIVFEDMVPFAPERMKPLPNAAHEGRANPKGIPCLYLAADEETALSEVRPWVGAVISTASFTTTDELRLVDFTVGYDLRLTPEHLFGPLPDKDMTEGVWAQVDRAFSEPVADDPSTAEYVPTQIITEHFRRAGHDGIVYRSRLGKGLNYALFDLESVRVLRRRLRKVTGVTYDFESTE